MRITLLNQFYPPDVAPTGIMLRGLAAELVRRGHDVQVIVANQSYNREHVAFEKRETHDGVNIQRLPVLPGRLRSGGAGRLINDALFMLQSFCVLLFMRPRPDLIVCMTTPPFLGVVARMAAACRRTQHAHWIMDLYPDVMRAYTMIVPGGMADRVLSALTRFSLKGSATTLTIGPDMATKIRQYTTGPVSWIPLWSSASVFDARESDTIRSYRESHGWMPDDIVFMYSGNMGLGHRFHEFMKATVTTADDARVRWVFCGEGSRRGEVEAFSSAHPESHIELHSYVDADKLATHLAAADIQLVSLESQWQGCMVPSKLQGAFAVGRPVLYIGAAESSIACWIRDCAGGWVVAPDDMTALQAALSEAMNPDVRLRYGANAAAFAREHFTAERNTARIAAQLESAMAG